MSAPEQRGSGVPKEEKKKGLNKVWERWKTVLKKGESSSSKRQSILSRQSPATKAGPSKEPVAPKSEPAPVDKALVAKAKYENMDGVHKLTKGQMLEERAKKLGERYGLDIKASEWHTSSSDDTVLRIDKPIRMRVRRTCHMCNESLSAAKECPSCQHTRCNKCPRYPPKRTEAEIIASRERRAAIIKANKENAPIVPDYNWTLNDKEFVLTRPSKTGGRDLVHKKPRQRVRRTCHECQNLFNTGSKECSCGHVRCTDCPRDPAKKDKYPFGYPGDQWGPSAVPHYECIKCTTIYPRDTTNGTPCRTCKTVKTDDSPRVKPRKIEPEPDPEILQRVQARLVALKVT